MLSPAPPLAVRNRPDPTRSRRGRRRFPSRPGPRRPGALRARPSGARRRRRSGRKDLGAIGKAQRALGKALDLGAEREPIAAKSVDQRLSATLPGGARRAARHSARRTRRGRNRRVTNHRRGARRRRPSRRRSIHQRVQTRERGARSRRSARSRGRHRAGGSPRRARRRSRRRPPGPERYRPQGHRCRLPRLPLCPSSRFLSVDLDHRLHRGSPA